MTDTPDPPETPEPTDGDATQEPRPIASGRIEYEDRGSPGDRETKDER